MRADLRVGHLHRRAARPLRPDPARPEPGPRRLVPRADRPERLAAARLPSAGVRPRARLVHRIGVHRRRHARREPDPGAAFPIAEHADMDHAAVSAYRRCVGILQLLDNLPEAVTRSPSQVWWVLARSLGEQGAAGRTALAWRWALTGACPSPVTLSIAPGRPPGL